MTEDSKNAGIYIKEVYEKSGGFFRKGLFFSIVTKSCLNICLLDVLVYVKFLIKSFIT